MTVIPAPLKILWKYLKKREKWSGVPDYAD
jgi:hypothetical protein